MPGTLYFAFGSLLRSLQGVCSCPNRRTLLYPHTMQVFARNKFSGIYLYKFSGIRLYIKQLKGQFISFFVHHGNADWLLVHHTGMNLGTVYQALKNADKREEEFATVVLKMELF